MRSSGRASITGEAMIPHRFLRRSRVQEWPPRDRTTSAGMMAADGDATTDTRWLLYGATGYTGRLIARMAVQRGLRPTLAGRNPGKVGVLAAELGLESRVAALEDPAAVDAMLSGVTLVLHCAGPFIPTFRPMVEACLRTGTHYLDITGEYPVFEALAARDAQARAAGIMVLPGAGFGVVPSDCLAAPLKRRLPPAHHPPPPPPARSMSWLLHVPGGRRLIRRSIMRRPPGPTDAERARGMSLLWGEAVDAPGRRVISRMRGPDGYTFTALAALIIVGRGLCGRATPGFPRPAGAFGTAFG